MTTIIIINALALVLIPGVTFWLIKSLASLYSNLVICILLIAATFLIKEYGFTNDLIFANIALLFLIAPAILNLLFHFDKNKHLKIKKIKGVYEDQMTLKILPFKYKLIKVIEFYVMSIGLVFLFSILFLVFNKTSDSMQENISNSFNSLDISVKIPLNINESYSHYWYLLSIAFIGGVLSGIIYLFVRKIKKKMLPVFWRAQLLPVFNPKSEIYTKVTEIMDKEYLRKIFEVNDFLVLETNAERYEQYKKNLNYIANNYPLNILSFQKGFYYKGTTIGASEINGEYHFFFLEFKLPTTPPPSESSSKEIETKENSSLSGGVANAI